MTSIFLVDGESGVIDTNGMWEMTNAPGETRVGAMEGLCTVLQPGTSFGLEPPANTFIRFVERSTRMGDCVFVFWCDMVLVTSKTATLPSHCI